MKIVEVRPWVLDHQLDQPFQSAFSGFTSRTTCLVEIVCDNGLVGWGEALAAPHINAAIIRSMRGLLIGKNPLDIEQHWLTLYNQFRDQGQRGAIITALSGIDVALWDIAGKHFDAPVHRLMGGAWRHRVRAYATGAFRRTSGDRIEYIAEETAGYVAEGFTAVKIKIGFDPKEDIAVCEAVRDAIGPETGFMIDANHGYDAIEAIRVGNAVEECDIDWFEEPVVPEDLESYREIRAGQPIPVAGGETWHTRWGFRDVLTDRAVDIIQPDVCGVGGLKESKKIAAMAETFGVRCVPHVWGTGIAIAAALQFLAVLPPNPPRHESLEPLLEFDRTHNPYRQAILKSPIEQWAGWVRIPDGPGLGIEIDRDAVTEYAIDPA